MYYKSLLETLKDEGDNRIRVEDEFSSNDEYRAEITLIPKDINICPSSISSFSYKISIEIFLLQIYLFLNDK